ncbi:MAG: hypothetical protein H3C54_07995, partial [Taibaiella sp.]|nr:hypothetical protein [Taibaiella sp.]
MKFSILQKEPKKDLLIILDNTDGLKQTILTKEETAYVQKAHKDNHALVTLNRYDKHIFIYIPENKPTDWQFSESIRETGASVQGIASKHKIGELSIHNLSKHTRAAYLLAEGMTLANYQ